MAYERKTYDLFISDELREVLNEFATDSMVAQLLLKKRHDKEELIDSPVNFISVSREDSTKISYVSQERMAIINPDEYWTSSRRFIAKPGAFISKIFKNIPSKEVEKFSNLYRSTVTKPKFTFKVVKGEDIRGFYYYESYVSERGSLGASCMKHDSCQKYLDVYVDSPLVKMLVMLDDFGRLMGRALLWDFESYKIMDRIYTTSDEELQFYFKKWATDSGYLHKSSQNWFDTLNFEQVGQKRQELKLCIKINMLDYRRFPYMDTFKFMESSTGYLYNYMPEGHFVTLCSSDGSSHGSDYLRFDGVDRVLRYRNDSNFVDYLNIWTSCNNTSWSEVNDQYILNSHCEYDQEIQDVVFAGEYAHLNNTQRIEDRRNYYKERSQRAKRITKSLNISDIERLSSQLGVSLHDALSHYVSNIEVEDPQPDVDVDGYSVA